MRTSKIFPAGPTEELQPNGRRWRDARAAGPLVKNMIGNAAVIRHADVCPLLRDKRLRGVGMDLDRMVGIPEGSRTWRFHQHFPLFMNGGRPCTGTGPGGQGLHAARRRGAAAVYPIGDPPAGRRRI